MGGDWDSPPDGDPPARRRGPRVARILAWTAGALVALAVLGAILVAGLNTDAGRRFLVDRIAEITPGSGLRVRIGRIEGSVYGRMTLRDVRLSDPQGLFLEASSVTLDWRPFAWSRNRLDVRELASPLVRLHRLPKLRSTGPRKSNLPGFDIHVGRLALERVWIGPQVAGQPRIATLIGNADIRDGRALIDLGARTIDGGDRMAVKLDAAPDRDRFDLEARLIAPLGGVIARAARLQRPLDVIVSGDGQWAGWKGVARASYGDARLLELRLAMRDGRFTLGGVASLSDVTSGKVQRLAAPRVLITGAGKLAERRVNTSLSLRSTALSVDATGIVDLGSNRFEGLKLNAHLLRPPALFLNMGGRPIHLVATIAGPMAGPTVDYRATTPFVSFDNTGFEQVSVTGRASLAGERKLIPVLLNARRVTGVGDVAGGILANLRVQGPLYLTWPMLASDALNARSDLLKGRVGVRINLNTGRFEVNLLGTLARYMIPGVGIVDVESRLRVVPGAGRGTMLTGTARAHVRRLDNAFFRSLAGGLPVIDARLRRGADRRIIFDELRLVAPEIRLSGRGVRRVDGSFEIEASGDQSRYGPVIMALDGNISRPTVALQLARPGLGMGLADVTGRLDPEGEGWRFTARGQSTLGPFTATGRLDTPAGAPLTIDIARLDVAGVDARGRLRSVDGVFAGRLAIGEGSVTGELLLSPQNGIQRIEAHLQARRARFPGPPPIRIGAGRLDGVALLDPAGPTVEGTAQGRGLSRGDIRIGWLDLKTSIKAGRGTLTASAAGRRGTPFELQGSAEFSPGRIAISGNGTLDKRPLRLIRPAVLTSAADGWRLASTAISYGGGTAAISGQFGDAIALDARLNRMPLSLLDLVSARLGLGGQATGTAQFRLPADGGSPTGRANLSVQGITRSGLVLTSRPVDLGVSAILDGNRAALRTIVKSDGKIVGRAQALASPIPGGDQPFAQRLLAAPLFAQLRYTGPADTLWRLTAIESVDLTGPISVAADATGRLGEPVIRGRLRADGTRLESALTGTVVENIKAVGGFNGSRLVIPQFSGTTAQGGTVAGRASFDLAAANGFGMDVAVDAKNARLLARDDISATVTGPLAIRSDGAGGIVSGEVRLDSGSFRFGTASATEIPQLAVTEINRTRFEDDEDARPTKPWTLDIKARGRNRLIVTGMGLDSEWRADLDISGRATQPNIKGAADLVRGTYEFAGRRFDLTRGQIRFPGGYPADPILDIVAEADVQGLSANIRVGGTGLRPEITFASIPALPEDEVLSRLLFGTSIANLSAPEALQLAAAVASLRTGGSTAGLNPLSRVGKAIGVDRLRIAPGDQSTGQGAMLAAGKYLSRRVYVEVASDAQGNSATQIEVELSRWLSVLSRLSTLGETSVNVQVRRDY
jgi:translocation and assembly module TamB